MMQPHELLLFPIFRFTRSRRMRRFERTLKPRPSDQVLDIGGGSFNWQFVSTPLRATLLNLYRCPVTRLSPRRFGGRGNVEHLRDLVDEVRLLSKREMREMFPDCRVITERFLLMPKSYIAVRD